MILPNEVIIELTNECNLDCDFCFNSDSGSELPIKSVIEILDEISQGGVKAVRFTGGEPLLYKGILSVVKHAKTNGLKVILNTNATQDITAISGYVDLFLFSFHDINQFHNLNKTVSGIENKSMIATIAVRDNIKELGRYYDCISEIKPYDWFVLRPLPNTDFNVTDVKELVKKIIHLNQKHKMNCRIANAIPFCSITEEISQVSTGGLFDSGYTRILVDSLGKIRPDYSSDIVIGNISINSVIEAWNSSKMLDLRSYKLVPRECKDCFYLDKCKGGLVFSENLRNFDNIQLNSPKVHR